MSKVLELRGATAEQMVGGKAASLGALLRAGFRVPDGFVVAASGELGEAEILAAFDKLGAKFVAVRSSAVNEDGSDAAWAGQLDTFLNVPRAALLERIRDCAGSAESARAKAYAAEKGVSAGGVAVVAQAMVASEISGVAFSAHPVTGSREQMVVEAGLGLGEAIVSGDITPDTYVVDATSGAVVESYVSTQTKRLVRGEDGDSEWQAIDPPMAEAKLRPHELSEIVDNLRRIAEHYGFSVDIEWAYAGSKLYILQARPITTL